jgi:hypothetical protein
MDVDNFTPNTTQPKATWADGIHAVHTESGGLMRMFLIGPADQDAILSAAMDGDRIAWHLLRLVSQSLFQIADAPRRKPALCLCCPQPIRQTKAAAVFCFVLPDVTSPEHGIGSAVCEKCARHADLLVRATTAFRRLWPDLRTVDISAQCGHG